MQNNSTYRIFEDKADQLFHNGLPQREFVPAENDWDALRQRLDEHDKEKRPQPPYRRPLLALLLLLLTGAVVYTAVQQINGTKKNEPVVAQAGTQKSNNNTVANGTSGNQPGVTTTTEPVAQEQPAGTGVNPQQTGTVNTPSGNNTHTTNANTNDVATGTANTQSPAGNALTRQQQSNNNPPSLTGFATTKKNKKLVAGRQNNFNSYAKNTRPKPNRNNGRQQAPVIQNQELEIGDDEMDEVEIPVPVQITEITTDKTITDNTTPTSSVLETGSTTTAATTPVTKTKEKEKRTRTRPEPPVHEFSSQGQWFAEGFAGYTQSTKDEKSFAAFLAPAGYLEKRINQESALPALQAGVLLKYRKNHLVLGTGLTYTELGDQVRYDAAYSGTVALGANGRSKLSYLQVPLTVGYEGARKRWGFTVQGGLIAGVLLNAKGNYVSTSNFTSQLFNLHDNKSIFRKTVFSLVVSPSLHYYLNDNNSLFISPTYQRNLQPVTQTGAELSQKYSALGFRFGISTRLSRR